MKITGYRLEKFTQQLDRAIGDSNFPAGDDLMNLAVLWIDTDEGISGIAPAGNDEVAGLFHIIEGKDPRGVVGLWKDMVDWVHKGNNEGAVNGAIAAIDIAWSGVADCTSSHVDIIESVESPESNEPGDHIEWA